MSDKTTELIARAQTGDARAVGELYDRYHERIFQFVWSRTGHKQLAEDLTGEVFTRMVTGLPDYEMQGVPFHAWLYRIARNLITDHYRRESNRPAVPLTQVEDLKMDDPRPPTLVEHRLMWERVQHALDQIDPAQREVLELRFLAGLSLREVAHTLDKTVAAVKSLQHRGLVALRATIAMIQ